MNSIILIVDYFGAWPEWFPIYLESCRANPSVNWLFHTDCPCDFPDIPNVEFRRTSLSDYIAMASEKLGIKFCPTSSYKLCDLRPMYGELYEEEIRGYDFFGYTDIDLIYGDIRKFYTETVLRDHDVISAVNWCLSGHLALLRNNDRYRRAYQRLKNWREFLEDGEVRRFDEDEFSKVFSYPMFCRGPLRALYDVFDPSGKPYRQRKYFREQYTTPLTPWPWIGGSSEHPQTWYWKDGHVTNCLDKDREFIYFHFMNYKNARYMDPAYAYTPFWSGLKTVLNVTTDDMGRGIRIDPSGFHALDSPVIESLRSDDGAFIGRWMGDWDIGFRKGLVNIEVARGGAFRGTMHPVEPSENWPISGHIRNGLLTGSIIGTNNEAFSIKGPAAVYPGPKLWAPVTVVSSATVLCRCLFDLTEQMP